MTGDVNCSAVQIAWEWVLTSFVDVIVSNVRQWFEFEPYFGGVGGIIMIHGFSKPHTFAPALADAHMLCRGGRGVGLRCSRDLHVAKSRRKGQF